MQLASGWSSFFVLLTLTKNDIVLYLKSYRRLKRKLAEKKTLKPATSVPTRVNITNNVKINTLLPYDLFIDFVISFYYFNLLPT